jgi:hypothetical protein
MRASKLRFSRRTAVLALAVSLLFLTSIGYGAVSDSMSFNAAISLAAPTEEPCGPWHGDFSFCKKGYRHDVKSPFFPSLWAYAFDLRGGWVRGNAVPVISRHENNVKLSARINVPKGGGGGDSLFNKARFTVGAALLFEGEAGRELTFTGGNTPENFGQSFALVHDGRTTVFSGKGGQKPSASMRSSGMDADRMVVSAFSDGDWEIQKLLPSDLTGNTYTLLSDPVSFRIYDVKARQTIDYAIQFEMILVTGEEEGCEVSPTLAPPEQPAPTQEPAPSAAPGDTNIWPEASVSDIYIRDVQRSGGNIYPAPYFAASYTDRSGKRVQKEITPVCHWENDDTLIVYANVYVPQAASPGAPRQGTMRLDMGAAMRLVNMGDAELTVAKDSLAGGLAASFGKGKKDVSDKGPMRLLSGESGIVSAWLKDGWHLSRREMDLQNLPGMTCQREWRMTFTVIDKRSGESREYAMLLVLSVMLEEAAATPTPAPTAEPTVAPTQAPAPAPMAEPTIAPIQAVTPAPTAERTAVPTQAVTPAPTADPAAVPTQAPTPEPTAEPTAVPTAEPTAVPTQEPAPTPMAEPEVLAPAGENTPGPEIPQSPPEGE